MALYPPFYPPQYPSAAPTSIVPAQIITPTGGPPVHAAARSGDGAKGAERAFVHFLNAGLVPITVTITTPMTFDGLEVDDRAVTVPVDDLGVFVALDPAIYGDQHGVASWAYSSRAGVTRAVLKT